MDMYNEIFLGGVILMKRILSLILSLSLLAGLCAIPVAADEGAVLTTDAFQPLVKYSITDSNISGWGLGFCFNLNANNVSMNSSNNATNLTKATLTYNGAEYSITRIGAVVTNRPAVGDYVDRMVRETVQEEPALVKDVSAKWMYRATATYCLYAVRVVNIPFEQAGSPVYARPYVEIQMGEELVTLYGEITSTSYEVQMDRDVVKLPGYGKDVDGKGRITVGETAVLNSTAYIQIVDELDEWMTMFNPERPDKIYYACYDKDGNQLTSEEEGYGYFYIRDMSSINATETFTFEMPEGTAEIRILGAEIIYWTEWE